MFINSNFYILNLCSKPLIHNSLHYILNYTSDNFKLSQNLEIKVKFKLRLTL